MAGLCGSAAETTSENGGNKMPSGAIHCMVARAIWPTKTAACWAAAAGVHERAAKYWLAPDSKHPVSDSGKLAVIVEITKRS